MTTGTPAGASDPRLIAALAYLGGVITGIVILSLEKKNRFVRFHAMQSTITFLGVLVLHLVLTGLPVIGSLLRIPFVIGSFGLWIFLMVKAFSGQTYKLPYVGDFAEQQLR